MIKKLLHPRSLAMLLCLGTMFGAWGNTVTIWAKAHLAQHLIKDAWQQTLEIQEKIPPWPWADTWPVARLKNKYLKEDLFVLSGANGTSLAFGPGHMDGTAKPNTAGTSVLAGHKDTHFEFLKDIKLGDRFYLQSKDGHWKAYETITTDIVDSSQNELLLDAQADELVLVTCYPFDSSVVRGPLRYVVRAKPMDFSEFEQRYASLSF